MPKSFPLFMSPYYIAVLDKRHTGAKLQGWEEMSGNENEREFINKYRNRVINKIRERLWMGSDVKKQGILNLALCQRLR